MPKYTYPFKPGGPKRLELSWGFGYRNFKVSLDGQEVTTLRGPAELLLGQQIKLPDGSPLSLKLERKWYGSQLEILRNGKPVPGSASHPDTRLRNAYWIIYVIAGLNILLGAFATLLQSGILIDRIGLGLYNIIFGIVFGVLGYFTSRRSSLALALAVTFYALDAIIGVASLAISGGSPNYSFVLVRTLFLIPMVMGFSAIKELEAEQKAAAKLAQNH